ncbi:MAG: RsmE family RNA methyltransferase [Bacteroidia bacterium]
MQLFLLSQRPNGTFFLENEEAHHCMRVLRHGTGDHIHAIDGKGNKYECLITASSKKEVELDILVTEARWGEPPYQLRLGLSPLRLRDRFETAIEKAVELGVSEIAPLTCSRTVKTGLKMERIEKIATAAVKQCKRSRIPDLPEIQKLENFMNDDASEVKLIAWCEAAKPIRELEKAIQEAASISILIGPEGDFSEQEVAEAAQKGYIPVSLGQTRLRTETAAMYAVAVVKTMKGF